LGRSGCDLQNLKCCGAAIEKKQIITVFEPMYLEILNNDMVGFASTNSRYMVEHVFLFYGSITAVDLEHNFENMQITWDPQQPVKTLFKQIQDCVDYAESGGIIISEAQKLTPDYVNIFSTGNFHSDYRHWNARNHQDQTWNNIKIQFSTAYPQHKQMQGETAAASGYANVAVSQPEFYDLYEAVIDAFFNLATATAVDRGIVATLTGAHFRLTKQLEETAQTLKEIRALLKKERNDSGAHILLITTVGLMVTRLQENTPVKVACIPRPDISMKQPRTITWGFQTNKE
jgi:hypothetical protein